MSKGTELKCMDKLDCRTEQRVAYLVCPVAGDTSS